MNLAFLISRFETEKSGPLETYCRTVAENLYKRGIDVTVYRRKEEKKEGEYILNGVLIKRFSEKSLLKNLLKDEDKFDIIVFFGIPEEAGLKEAERIKSKKILVPYLYRVQKERDFIFKTFSRFDGLVFITEREKENLELEAKKYQVIEFGIDVKREIDPLNFRKNHLILSDYILCHGNDENIKEVLEYFINLKRYFPFITLVISGKFSTIIPFFPDINVIELKDEKERLECIKGSIFTIFPSSGDEPEFPFFETMGLGVPVVVSERRKVFVDYCLKSNGGLWFSDKNEFLEIASLLIKDKILRNKLGRNAKKYIKENHSPELIYSKWREFLISII